jgi:DNA-binding response OmpR family regulator
MKTILLIDDAPYILENLTEYLQMEGYKILTASNGENGIELANNSAPDLIICDVSMPGISGYEVLNLLKSSTKTSEIPFIFITSMIEKIDVPEAFRLGADNYIVKPFEPETLLEMVRNCLETREKQEPYHESFIS